MAFLSICRILVSIIIFSNGETAYELYSIGCQLELDGKVEEAIQHYVAAKDLAPESPKIYLSLANALYKIRKFDEGIRIAEEALLKWHDNIHIYNSIAIGNIGKRELKKAIQAYEKGLQIESDNIDIRSSLSVLYEGINNLTEAKQILIDLPDSIKTPEIYSRLGALAGKVNDHGSAIEYYRKGYQLDTTNTKALIGIGTGFDIINVKDSAIHYYEKALRNDSFIGAVGKRLVDLYSDTDQYESLIEMAHKIIGIDSHDAHIRRSLGYALYKTGKSHEALNEFFIASRLDPQDTYSRFYAGRIYLENAEYETAFKEISEAIKINPDFIELWIYLGFIAIDLKDFKTAEYAFTEAAHHGADMAQVYYLLGVCAEMQQHQSQAHFYYHKSLRVNPTSLAALEALASLSERNNRKDEAFKAFQTIISLDTTNAEALNYVGYYYAEQNDSLEYALQLINKAISYDENNGYYIDSRGWVLYQMGRYEEALKDIKRAAESVEDAVILEHLGDVYMKLDDSEKAYNAYLKALEYSPGSEVLKAKIRHKK